MLLRGDLDIVLSTERLSQVEQEGRRWRALRKPRVDECCCDDVELTLTIVSRLTRVEL